MKKSIIIILIVILGCSTKKIVISKQEIYIVTSRIIKAHNQSLPCKFIHINSFKDFEINYSTLIKYKNYSYAKELRFNATY